MADDKKLKVFVVSFESPYSRGETTSVRVEAANADAANADAAKVIALPSITKATGRSLCSWHLDAEEVIG